ncbi:MAG: anaerobic ribonucleoside-triphosphate reductase activating protein [Nanoarchaeota archaeon]|nr:anaerobic ribonucleoside-triphosphate reductase activating protein [Nanoarchaeota archaeon]MBU0962527.1 anaerobic ribonucleoside-triphosphate reductase activating protein [Nanoarchaeota archaeon]
MKNIKIGGILDLSTVDYPKKTAAVVFMQGCNFRCPFCYNPDLINGKGKEISIKEIVENIKKKDFIDAVVITGGEPTLQPESLIELCRQLKENKFLVKIDTNGSNPLLIKELIDKKFVDYIALDVKAPLNEKYLDVIKVKNKDFVNKIRDVIDILKNSSIEYELRTPIVPGLNDSPKDLEQHGNDVKDAKIFILEQFTPENGTLDKSFEKIKSPSYNDLKEIAKYFKNKKVVIKAREVGEQEVSRINCGCN